MTSSWVQRTSFGSLRLSDWNLNAFCDVHIRRFFSDLSMPLSFPSTCSDTCQSVNALSKHYLYSQPQSASLPPASGSLCCCPASPSSHHVWERKTLQLSSQLGSFFFYFYFFTNIAKLLLLKASNKKYRSVLQFPFNAQNVSKSVSLTQKLFSLKWEIKLAKYGNLWNCSS